MSVPVVPVAGTHGTARAATVARLLREHPGALVIHHDLREITAGLVVRTVRDVGTTMERAVIRLEHGCVTCTVRQDLIPQVLRHARNTSLLIVDRWDCVEPRPVAEALGDSAWNGEVRLTSVLTALETVAGVMTIEDAGAWPAALPVAAWQETGPARRVAAALDWTPEHGDRVQHLAFTGPAPDHDQIHALLDPCLLRPEEAAVELDDPFADLLDMDPTA